jgi:hypothetical protein
MKTNHFFAQTISFILQPLLMPGYCIALLFAVTNLQEIYLNQLLWFLIPVFIFSFLLPVLFIYTLKKLRIIKDCTLSERRDRIMPYLLTCLSNVILIYYFYYAGHVYLWFLGVLAIPVAILVFAFIINLFYGICPHMLGIGGLLGGFMSVCFNVKAINPFLLFIVLFLLAGCLGAARLHIRRDTPSQVYTGFVAGFVLGYLCVWLAYYYQVYAINFNF